MPIYEYECNACGERHEFIQKFSDGAKRKCPSCGKSRLRKLISAAAFHLKGDGWYVTDFRDKGAKKDAGDGKTSGAGETTTESKPDAKVESKSDVKSGASTAKKGGKGKTGNASAST